jgi:hypothetical protein
MPTLPSSDPDTAAQKQSTGSARKRVLAGTEAYPRGSRPGSAPAAAAESPDRPAATPHAPVASDALPTWAKRVAICGVLLAVGMPLSVLMSRSMVVQQALSEQTDSQAVLVCTSGEGRAADSSSMLGWLFGGSHFQCNHWETREARQQREREEYEANYLARQRAKQGYN